jgi:hypothetical protein
VLVLVSLLQRESSSEMRRSGLQLDALAEPLLPDGKMASIVSRFGASLPLVFPGSGCSSVWVSKTTLVS